MSDDAGAKKERDALNHEYSELLKVPAVPHAKQAADAYLKDYNLQRHIKKSAFWLVAITAFAFSLVLIAIPPLILYIYGPAIFLPPQSLALLAAGLIVYSAIPLSLWLALLKFADAEKEKTETVNKSFTTPVYEMAKAIFTAFKDVFGKKLDK